MNAIRKTITGTIAALALSATVLATVTPAEAGQRHRRHGGNGGAIAAGIIGGLALGALAAGAARADTRSYYAPSYARPVYAGHGYSGYGYAQQSYYNSCYRTDQPAYNRHGHFVGYRRVTICD